MLTNKAPLSDAESTNSAKKKSKDKKLPGLINTFFRNALRSNLDLTSLADTKAGILISINGFILTVSVTASSFTRHSELMTYAFISIILTSLISIILAVLSVKPRSKEKLVKKEYLDGYESLLFYQDIANMSPIEHQSSMKKALKSTKKSKTEMISHLHILGAEIKKKYFWLQFAYTAFSIGLIISVSFMIYALIVQTTQISAQEDKSYSKGEFYNIFEPSGATTIEKNKILIVEDESSSRSLKLIGFDENHKLVETGNLHIPKKIKKVFKKEIEDLEAITSVGNTIFAITSHALNRSNEQKKAREQLLMLEYGDEAIVDMQLYGNLKEDIKALNTSMFSNTLLGEDKLSIEGLAYDTKESHLLLGLRAPTNNTDAIILPLLNPKELFYDEPEKPEFGEAIFVNLNGLGIRALVYDDKADGYWIIGGASDQRNGTFTLFFYSKATKQVRETSKKLDFGYTEGITIVKKGNKRFLFCVEDNGLKPNKSATYIEIDMDLL